MNKGIVDKNYAFWCKNCEIFINLATLLPRYEDI